MDAKILVGTESIKLDCLKFNNNNQVKTNSEMRGGGLIEYKPLVYNILKQVHPSAHQVELIWRQITGSEGRNRLVSDIESTNSIIENPSITKVKLYNSRLFISKMVNLISAEPNYHFKAIQCAYASHVGFVLNYKDKFILNEHFEEDNPDFENIRTMNKGMNIRLKRVQEYVYDKLVHDVKEVKDNYYNNEEVNEEVKKVLQEQPDEWIIDSIHTNVVYRYVRNKVKLDKIQMSLLQDFVTSFRKVYRASISIDELLPFFNISRQYYDDYCVDALMSIDALRDRHFDYLELD